MVIKGREDMTKRSGSPVDEKSQRLDDPAQDTEVEEQLQEELRRLKCEREKRNKILLFERELFKLPSDPEVLQGPPLMFESGIA